jgi:hypothetical protein
MRGTTSASVLDLTTITVGAVAAIIVDSVEEGTPFTLV